MRPEGWDVDKIAEKVCGFYTQTEIDLVEAGADAYEEGLKKIDTYVQVKEGGEILLSPAFQVSDWKKHRLVFIEEE